MCTRESRYSAGRCRAPYTQKGTSYDHRNPHVNLHPHRHRQTNRRGLTDLVGRCQADPDGALAFADNAPQNFVELDSRLVTGAYILYLVYDDAGDVAGAMWLHDIQRDPDGTPHTGWVGAYVLPTARHTGLATAMWHEVRTCLEARGIRHFFAAVHITNTRSQAYATRYMGLHVVDRFAQFTRFGGVLTDCLIHMPHPEDAATA